MSLTLLLLKRKLHGLPLLGLFLFQGNLQAQSLNTLKIETINKSLFCTQDSVYVTYSVLGNADAGNQFVAELSNENGNFSNPVRIGASTSGSSGVIPGVLPANINAGAQYRIRVVATAPVLTGSDNGVDLPVKLRPQFDFSLNPMTVCAGASLTLAARVSDPGQTKLSWNHGVTDNLAFVPSATETYTAVANNGHCTVADSITVTVKPLPYVKASATPNPVCAGEPVKLQALVGLSLDPVTYTWDNNVVDRVTFVPSGTKLYTVMAQSGDCRKTDTITVVVKPLPKVKASATPNQVCAGDQVKLQAVGGLSMDPVSYTWDNNVTDRVSFVPTATKLYKVTATSGTCKNTDTITVEVKSLPKVKASATANPVCAGDEVKLQAVGGLSPDPVTYTWDNNVIDRKAFVPTATILYKVTATSGTCKNTDTITVEVKALPSVKASASSVAICEGQEVTLQAITGISPDPVTYSWDQNVTDRKAFVPTRTQLYTVTATAGSCNKKDTITVTMHPLPKVTATASASKVCKDDQVTLNGGGAATYSWDHNVTDNKAFAVTTTTTYTVTGKDNNNCENKATMTIEVNQPVSLTINKNICKKSAFDFGGQQLTLAGIYTDTLTAGNGCDSIITLNLAVDSLDLTIVANKDSLTAPEEMTTYQWIDCNTKQKIEGEDHQVFLPKATGNYAVVVSNGTCSDTSACHLFTYTPTGITQTQSWLNTFQVYPNPTSAILNIVSVRPLKNAEIRLSNIMGQTIRKEIHFSGSTVTLDISKEPGGVYIIDITENAHQYRTKIVKE